METVFCSNKVSILFIHRDIHRSLMAKNEASDSCIGLGSVDHCDSFFFGRPVFSAMILRGKDGHLSPWLAPVSLFFFLDKNLIHLADWGQKSRLLTRIRISPFDHTAT